MIGADYQQERLLDSPVINYCEKLRMLDEDCIRYFLAGFVDGEGSFNVSFAQHPTLKSRWIILTKFQIYQHQNHRDVLELFKEVLGTGRIDKKSGSDVLSLTVEGRDNLTQKIIPFFDRYPLATKVGAFQKFKIINEMMNQKLHRTFGGFEKIVRLAHTMNAEGRFRIHSVEYILKTAKENFQN